MADSREVAQRYADLLVARFNDIDADAWRKPWVSRTATPPKKKRNMSGREYRRSNRLMLPMLCEMKQWDMPLFMIWQHKYIMSYNNVFNIAQTDFQQKRPEQWQALEDGIRKGVDTTVAFSCGAFDDAIEKGQWLAPARQPLSSRSSARSSARLQLQR